MAIITISRGSYSKGKEVAEGIASRLNYECVSREVLLKASDQFNIPEIKLTRAIHDAPSVLDRFTHGKTAYIAYIQCALLEHARRGNIVYHGLAGHILLGTIPHVLKVRIITALDARVAAEMEREKLVEKEARSLILKDDEERRKWTKRIYGVDPWDPELYDLFICIDKVKVEGAIELVCETASFEAFRSTERAKQMVEDLALSCHVKSRLLDLDHNVSITSEYGNVVVHTKADDRRARKMEERIKALASEIVGIHAVEIQSSELRSSSDA